MEKGRGKGTDTLQTNNVFTRKEYIEREAAINAVFEAYADGRSAYIALEAIPAADVVPVVRCGECAYCEWKNEVCTYGWCKRISTFKMRDEYCSDGERRDGDG